MDRRGVFYDDGRNLEPGSVFSMEPEAIGKWSVLEGDNLQEYRDAHETFSQVDVDGLDGLEHVSTVAYDREGRYLTRMNLGGSILDLRSSACYRTVESEIDIRDRSKTDKPTIRMPASLDMFYAERQETQKVREWLYSYVNGGLRRAVEIVNLDLSDLSTRHTIERHLYSSLSFVRNFPLNDPRSVVMQVVMVARNGHIYHGPFTVRSKFDELLARFALEGDGQSVLTRGDALQDYATVMLGGIRRSCPIYTYKLLNFPRNMLLS